MSSSRTLLSSLSVCVALAATGAALAEDTDFITGKGLPNPNPVVVPNWGELPAGRNWGPQPVSILTPPTGTSGRTSVAVRRVSAVVCR